MCCRLDPTCLEEVGRPWEHIRKGSQVCKIAATLKHEIHERLVMLNVKSEESTRKSSESRLSEDHSCLSVVINYFLSDILCGLLYHSACILLAGFTFGH